MNIWSISRRGGYLEYKVQYIKKIPINNISEKEQKPFIDLVKRILVDRKNGKNTTDLEAEIDRLVYELFELTEEEIKIIENEFIHFKHIHVHPLLTVSIAHGLNNGLKY